MSTFDTAKLSDSELTSCLHEMRERGWIVACYDANTIHELIARNDVALSAIEQWLAENASALEQAMCEPIYSAIESEWPPIE